MTSRGFAKIGIVTGVEREAALLRTADRRLDVRCSGANAAVAYTLAQALAAEGAEALLSIGLAGGLDPRLGPGAIVVAEAVLAVAGESIDPMASAPLRTRLAAVFTVAGRFHAQSGEAPPPEADSTYAADPSLSERLAIAAGPRARAGALAGVDHVIARRHEKLGLFTKTRALAADMESTGVARAATEVGLPFGAVRVVLDPSNREMPRAMMRAVRPDGTTNVGAFLVGLALNPLEIGGCISVGLDALVAFRSLRRVGRGLAPALLGGL